MESLGDLWMRVRAPRQGFRARAAQDPALGEAVKGLLMVRTLPAFLALLFAYLGFQRVYGHITRMEGPLFDYLWTHLPDTVNPRDVREGILSLPPFPSWGHVLPWLVVLAPLGVLSLWFHDAVWDHLCLWLLRGLKTPRSFRLTLVADAECLKAGTFGTVLGLLRDLPGAGWILTLLLLPVGIYFWVLRGFALAAWHGCPPWKGVVATLLHALSMGLFVALTLGSFLLLVLEAVR
jgi:hypothetical protein